MTVIDLTHLPPVENGGAIELEVIQRVEPGLGPRLHLHHARVEEPIPERRARDVEREEMRARLAMLEARCVRQMKALTYLREFNQRHEGTVTAILEGRA